MLGLTWLRAASLELEAMVAHCGDHRALCMRADRRLHNGHGRECFAARKAEVNNGRYTIPHGFDDYISALEGESNANDFLRTPTSSPK